jgi:hypothetical protein
MKTGLAAAFTPVSLRTVNRVSTRDFSALKIVLNDRPRRYSPAKMFKALDLWLPAYLRRPRHRAPSGVTDIMLAVCDHFEPLHGADKPTALERIRRWKREFPPLIQKIADADGCCPRHTFFYPVEQYDSDIVAELAELCRLCGGEVELHLHHDRDTADGVRQKLERGKGDLARHGLLARDAAGNLRYGFIHGNWALANSHPAGRHCGVDNELVVLEQTGCYADFTMPSAPDPTQTRIINSLYYADENDCRKAHDTGQPVRVLDSSKRKAENAKLLLVQGPLGLNWECRKRGLFPRIENGEISGANPPRPDRMKIWTRLRIHVQGRPNWIFIKLHTHGGIPRNMATLLADPMRRFYEHLLARYNDGKEFLIHFVTAREMVNIIYAAEDGHSENPGSFRDYRLRSRLRD